MAGLGAGRREHGSSPRPDHLTRTAAEPRQECVTDARIVQVREETPTVREIHLEVADPNFSFKPGNWVDFFIDGCPKIGGYSMCSAPSELPRLRLAVKRSAHPPAAWCHSEACAPGAAVQMKAGGKFHWDAGAEAELAAEHLLFVAGGIGINPLYSMAQAALAAPPEAVPRLRRVSFLFSAARPSELAYRSHLEELARSDPRFSLSLRVTRNERAEQESWEGLTGRIDSDVLREALGQEAPDAKVLAFVCGPPKMTDDLVRVLQKELSLPADAVRFEKWW